MRLIQSPLRPALILLTAILLSAVCVGMAVPLFPDATPGRAQIYWWFGAFFFALGAFAVLKNSFGDNRPVLVLSPAGFHFNTVSADVIPWASVRGIHNWRQRRGQVMVVRVTDDIWDLSGMTDEARGARAGNKLAGIDGIAISAAGLPIGFRDLIRIFQAYTEAHGGKVG